MLVFGGTGTATRSIGFVCPETGLPFTTDVQAPGDDVELVPVDPSQQHAVEAAAPAAKPAPAADAEFTAWAASSRATAVDYCKTMLTTATGSIPVYFAVLRYLGYDKATHGFVAAAGIVPPVLFLVAAVMFVLALRPRLRAVTSEDFGAFRAERLVFLNRMLVAGLAVYGLGVALAIVFFFALLR